MIWCVATKSNQKTDFFSMLWKYWLYQFRLYPKWLVFIEIFEGLPNVVGITFTKACLLLKELKCAKSKEINLQNKIKLWKRDTFYRKSFSWEVSWNIYPPPPSFSTWSLAIINEMRVLTISHLLSHYWHFFKASHFSLAKKG